MTRQLSFKMHQREVEPHYRIQIDAAESTEDVRKFFERTAVDFLRRAVGDQIEVQPDDVVFEPESTSGYILSPRMAENQDFVDIHDQSDLPHILALLSDRAVGRYRYLIRKHPDKTEMKIFQVPGPRRT
ncbi:MAG: hypothetical protein EOL86_04800 [Deltaproteobacteria bacterium]|nr:hypothetical protein [Deltaproteobacteria bacterium]